MIGVRVFLSRERLDVLLEALSVMLRISNNPRLLLLALSGRPFALSD
jgi:hypothetical protein